MSKMQQASSRMKNTIWDTFKNRLKINKYYYKTKYIFLCQIFHMIIQDKTFNDDLENNRKIHRTIL